MNQPIAEGNDFGMLTDTRSGIWKLSNQLRQRLSDNLQLALNRRPQHRIVRVVGQVLLPMNC